MKLFISYRHSQIEMGRQVETQLLQAGLDVFRDEREIEPTESISAAVKQGLADSHAMLILLSEDYSRSRYCQWELTAAFIAAQQAGQAIDRIFVLQLGDNNLLQQLPIELADALYLKSDDRELGYRLQSKMASLTGTLGEQGAFTLPPAYGRGLTGSPRFVGREQVIWKLHSALQASQNPMITGHTKPDIAEVSGMGGIGKTLLAEEYALRFGAAYPGGIFWLDAYGSFNPGQPDIELFKASCAEQYRKVALSLQLQPAPDEDLLTLRARIALAIREQGQRCLWIVDDIPQGLATHLEEIKLWFSPCPELAPTMVTTRSREYHTIGTELALDVLDMPAALDLLRNNELDLDGQEGSAKQLIKQLGYHALALDIAGASIREYQLTVDEYLQELADDNSELLEVPAETVAALPTGCATSIIKTFQRSLKHLNPLSLDMLRLAANLAPAPIPQTLFEWVLDKAGEVKKRDVRTALQGCKQAHLISQKEKDWSLHALIATTLHHLELATDEKGQALKLGAIAYLTEAIKHEGIDHQQEQALSSALEHGRYLTRQIEDEPGHMLLTRIGDFDHYRGNPAMAALCWRKINQWRSDAYGEDHPDTLSSMNNLASTLKAMGDHRGAKALHEEELARCRKVLGEDHPSTLTSMNNLAGTLKAMGDHSGAKAHQEHVLARRQAVLGEDHPDTLTSMSNLAQTLLTMGDHGGAKAHVEHVLARRQAVLGEDHLSTLISMDNLAQALLAMGDRSGAKANFEHVLARREAMLGEDHPDTLTSMGNLASALWQMGDHSGAKVLEEHVLARRQAVLGEDHPDTLTSMNNLASTLWQMGDHRGAKAHFEHVLVRRQAVLGEDHPDTLTSMNNLASTLWQMGDHSGAKVLEEHVLARRQAVLGEDHPDTLTSMNNLAQTLLAMGDHSGAKAHQEHVLARSQAVLGEDHPSTLTSMNNLALTLKAMGDHSGAKALEEHVLARRQAVLGEGHPSTVVSAWGLFVTLLQLDDQPAAKAVRQQYLQWLLTVDESELTSASLRNIRSQLLQMFNQGNQS